MIALITALISALGIAWAKPARFYFEPSVASSFAAEFTRDPRIACRRPSTYEALRTAGRVLGPSIDVLCPSFEVISERGERITLAPSRLFEVQYLIAGRGGGFASRFGHTMLRLVFCSPDRASVDQSCRRDSFDTIDVGFAAHTDTQTFSVIGGVTGRYPSWLTITPDSDLRHRYVDTEMRDLAAWPLALSDDAKRMVLSLIVEHHWAYDGRYKFLTNNCADEILKVLQLSLPAEHPLVKGNPSVMTPAGLFKDLKRAGLVSDVAFQWPSRRELLETNLQRLSLDPVARSVNEYVSSPAEVRLSWVRTHGRTHVGLFEALEVVAQRDARAKLTRVAIDALYRQKEPLGACDLTKDQLRANLEKDSARLSPAHLKDPDSAFVPLPNEVTDEAAIAERHARVSHDLNQIVGCFAHLPALFRAQNQVTVGRQIERTLKSYLLKPN